MSTYVTIINRVLRRLREDTVTNYDDTDYSTLIGDFVNEIIFDMQGRCEWHSLLDRFTFTTDGSSLVYTLTSSESEKSRDSNDQLVIKRIYNDTDDFDLIKSPYDSISRAKLYTTITSSQVNWYREMGVDSSGRRQVEVYPDVTGKTLVAETYNPHDEIAASATQVLLPSTVVFAGAYALAVDERGEDAGTAARSAWNLYQTKLADAIGMEQDRYTPMETDWRVE